MEEVTKLIAPMIELSPMLAPFKIITRLPIQTLSPTLTGFDESHTAVAGVWIDFVKIRIHDRDEITNKAPVPNADALYGTKDRVVVEHRVLSDDNFSLRRAGLQHDFTRPHPICQGETKGGSIAYPDGPLPATPHWHQKSHGVPQFDVPVPGTFLE